MKHSIIPIFALAASLTLGLNAAAQQSQTLTMEQLPVPVQNVVKTETKNGPVTNIRQLTQNGRTIYQIGFQQPTGEKDIYLEANGSYVQQSATVATTAKTNGPVEVKLKDLPENVQKVINSETSAGPVKKIEQMAHLRRSIYKVTYQPPGAAEKVIYLNKDGSYVREQSQTAVGAPAGSSTGSRSSLSGASKVKLEQLPAAAQQAIKSYAGSAPVEDIDKGTLNGKTVYEAAFKQNGQTVELRVDEQGKIIQDSEDQAITKARRQ